MAVIGYHASHEQFPPGRLLSHVVEAERAGFSGAMCSDHFHPWSDRQGNSGFAWSWLGTALQATSLPMGVVNAPGQRYNPAIVAQAAATLAEMFPGRFWLAVGSGEDLNEHITGGPWPPKAERNARLLEAVDVIRALWRGETVNHRGRFTVADARLYTLPPEPPLVVGAAVTAETAAWVATWADALITVDKPFEQLREVVDAFRGGGGEAKPMLLQSQISYARSIEEAEAAAHDQWRTNVFSSAVLARLRMPAEFDQIAEFVRPSDMAGSVRISPDPAQHAEWISRQVELGFSEIHLHNVHPDQTSFIEDFGQRVLPDLQSGT
ncbi:MAG TPA: TIGR03885 family FMN-dependent LLM class oxidoreductase [Actinomycetota bacterium]|nr:TIGR03885 family FMN-dependent LLM class oxidoreductase [Actinomycetota bacterium]